VHLACGDIDLERPEADAGTVAGCFVHRTISGEKRTGCRDLSSHRVSRSPVRELHGSVISLCFQLLSCSVAR
jgi:hypothetical protein